MKRIETVKQVSDRFWSKVDKTSDCWLWIASCERGGYGQFKHDGKNRRAHRIGYVLQGGEELADPLDHICNNRRCVRREHLRYSTIKDNVLRSLTNPVAINARRTHCCHGHAFTPQNTRISTARGYVERSCITCRQNRRVIHQGI